MSRRSTRTRAQPQSLADEQVTHRYHAQDLADLRRATQLSLQPDCPSDSEEEEVGTGEASSSEEEGDEKENIPPHSQWVKQTHPITLPPFIIDPGSTLPRHRVHTEMGYLQCFLTPSLVSTIATNTNLYATSKQAPAGWATSADEVWLFIAVHIFMGIVELPSLPMYWEERWRQGYVSKAFSRDRFKELLRYFHIAEPTPAGVRHTVIDKIRPLHDSCLSSFPDYFTPPRDFTVDETMVRFKGRSAWKTVIKGKPTPIGYKVYTLASHGYLLNFDVYKGKGGYATRQGVIHHTVTQLVTRWSNANRILFLDNLYTSPALCRHLLRIGIRSCGTLRPNRTGLPSDLRAAMKEVQVGQTRAWQSDQLGCLVWCDKRPVLMLSTHHKVDDMVTLTQNRGPTHPPTVTKPQVALDYNVGKCHVDTVDQLRQYYAMQRKSMKNWPSLAWWLIDMCIINAYTLWRLDTKAPITQFDFRETLLQQLAATYPPHHTRQQPTVPPHSSRPADGHWPKHSHKTRECRYCSMGRAGRKKSEVVCKECGVHLCLEPCFELYHTAQ
jgi:Transposase IS4/DDE_Tnp_1-like zinc-ribbon